MQRILGDEHPDTIKVMGNLANTLRDQGKTKEAAVMTQEVLKKMQRSLGDEHPDTITAIGRVRINYINVNLSLKLMGLRDD